MRENAATFPLGRYWNAIDPRTEIPPMGFLPYRTKRATPYIYSDEEIEQLLNAANNLPPSTGLRPWTYWIGTSESPTLLIFSIP